MRAVDIQPAGSPEASAVRSGKGSGKKRSHTRGKEVLRSLDTIGGGVGAAGVEKGQRISHTRHRWWLSCGIQALCVTQTETEVWSSKEPLSCALGPCCKRVRIQGRRDILNRDTCVLLSEIEAA